MNRHGSSALLTIAAIAGGLVFVLFGALVSGAGLTFSPLLFVALAVAIGVAAFLYARSRKGTEAGPVHSKESDEDFSVSEPEPTPASTGTGPGVAASAVTEIPSNPIHSDRAEGSTPSQELSGDTADAPSVEGLDPSEADGDDVDIDVAGDEDGTAMRAATDEIVTVEEPEATDPATTDDVERDVVGHPPGRLDAPREGRGDDLKQLRGVGPKLEEELNAMGIYHLDQIAGWTPEELAWVDANLQGFKGRASRDDWVAQARELTERDN